MGAASGYSLASLLGVDSLLGVNAAGLVKRFAGTEVAKLNVASQTIVGGAGVTPLQLSISASPDVDLVIDPSLRPIQYVFNVAPFRIGFPTVDGNCLLMIFNTSPSIAGAVTFSSSYRVGSNTGDTIGTTADGIYTVSIWRGLGVGGYNIFAHQ